MSDFDKIIKDAVQGFEAPFDAGAWDKLSSQLSPLEDAFRDSVDGYEAPYNPKAWSAIKGQIGSGSTVWQWVAGSAAAAALIAGTIALLPDNHEVNVNAEADTNTNQLTVVANDDNHSTEENTLSLPAAIGENAEESTPNHSINPVDTQEENLPSENNAVIQQSEGETNTSQDPTNDQTQVSGQEDVTTNGGDSNGNDEENNSEVTENGEENNMEEETYLANFAMSVHEVCLGENVIFNPQTIHNNVTYVWDFGDNGSSTEKATSHVFEKPGNYDVMLTLKDVNTNKVLASQKEQIIVRPLPAATFDWKKDNEILPTVTFSGDNEFANSWIWKVNGRMVSDRNQFEYTFREKGDHIVELSTKNEFGCSATSMDKISIDADYNLLAPTAFTPNGDNINENFIPTALTLMDSEFTMTIYNEGGKMIYQTNNVNMPWDGQDFNDNSAVPSGAYVWVVQLKNGNGTIENYKGQVFVTR